MRQFCNLFCRMCMLTHAVTFSEELLVLFAVKCLHAYYFISSVGSLVCLVHVISQFTKRKFSTTATCNCQICGFRLLLYNPTVASSETSHADQPPPMARPRQVNQIEKKNCIINTSSILLFSILGRRCYSDDSSANNICLYKLEIPRNARNDERGWVIQSLQLNKQIKEFPKYLSF